MNNLTVFSFQESHSVRVVMIAGEPWFVAQDVCTALRIQNVTQAIEKLDDDERSMLNIGLEHRSIFDSRVKEVNIISESGLYTIILRCRDAVKQGTTAWRFRKWVTNEVLPAIRTTGSYSFVEPAPKSAGEPLHWRHKNELQQLVNDIARTFRYNKAWVVGIWFALRRSCNNPSPNPLTTDDLPAVLFELRRIACSVQMAANVMSDYEKELLQVVVRKGHEIDEIEGLPSVSVVADEQPLLPAYLERAFQRLESMERLVLGDNIRIDK